LNAVILPEACTVTFLKVAAYNFSGAGSDTLTYTVWHNGSATSMGCSLTVAAGAKASCTDTTHTFSVADLDTLTLAIGQTNDVPYVQSTTSLFCE
jgi:hypothetical protein